MSKMSNLALLKQEEILETLTDEQYEKWIEEQANK